MSAGYCTTSPLMMVVLLCLTAIGCNCHGNNHGGGARATKAPTTTVSPSSNCTSTGSNLCTELQELRDLIPASTLIYITTKHFLHDVRFRQAMRFLRSKDFAEMAEKIEHSGPYQQMLQQFQDAGLKRYMLELCNITAILECLLLPDATCQEKPLNDSTGHVIGSIQGAGMLQVSLQLNLGGYLQETIVKQNAQEVNETVERAEGREVVEGKKSIADVVVRSTPNSTQGLEPNNMASRSFQSYLTEVMKAMPRWQFREAIENKVRKNKEFEKFYKTMRNVYFQRTVLDNLNSHELMLPLYKLKKNFIDVHRVLVDIFRILSWGPSVQALEFAPQN